MRNSTTAITEGYLWYVFPVNTAKPIPPHNYPEWWTNGRERVLTSYDANGILLLTENLFPPTPPSGWTVHTVELPEDWVVTLPSGWKFKVLHNYGGGKYVFAGLIV